MILGRDFAWGHVPKTGGDATWHLFRCVPDLVLQADSIDTPGKHRKFYSWMEGDHELILGIRRLPSVMLSMLHHVQRFGVIPSVSAPFLVDLFGGDYPRGINPDPEWSARCPMPDRFLEYFTNGGRLEISRWFRQEKLGQDFVEFVRTRRELSGVEEAQILAKPTPHHTELLGHKRAEYERDPLKVWTPEQVGRLYESNPTWARIEREVYRGTMLDSLSMVQSSENS